MRTAKSMAQLTAGYFVPPPKPGKLIVPSLNGVQVLSMVSWTGTQTHIHVFYT